MGRIRLTVSCGGLAMMVLFSVGCGRVGFPTQSLDEHGDAGVNMNPVTNRDWNDTDGGGFDLPDAIVPECNAHDQCATGTCFDGQCVEKGCVIENIYYLAGEANPFLECQFCNPAGSVDQWSPEPFGTPCADDGLSCTKNICGNGTCNAVALANQCVIDSQCYSAGHLNNGNTNEICTPSVNAYSWSAGSCTDGLKNGDEFGVDCGGSCGPCNACTASPDANFCVGLEPAEGLYGGFADQSESAGGNVSLGQDGKWGGEHGVTFDGPNSSSRALLKASIPAIHSGTMHGRFYMRVKNSISMSSGATRHFLSIGNAADDKGFGLGLKEPNKLEMSMKRGSGDYGYQQSPTGFFSFGEWHCVQFQVQIGAAGSMSVVVDGTPVTRTDLDTRPGSNGFDEVELGLRSTHQTVNNAEFSFDEFVIDDAPVPCL